MLSVEQKKKISERVEREGLQGAWKYARGKFTESIKDKSLDHTLDFMDFVIATYATKAPKEKIPATSHKEQSLDTNILKAILEELKEFKTGAIDNLESILTNTKDKTPTTQADNLLSQSQASQVQPTAQPQQIFVNQPSSRQQSNVPLEYLSVFWFAYSWFFLAGIPLFFQIGKFCRMINGALGYQKFGFLGTLILLPFKTGSMGDSVNQTIERNGLKIQPVNVMGILVLPLGFLLGPIPIIIDMHKIASKWNEIVEAERTEIH